MVKRTLILFMAGCIVAVTAKAQVQLTPQIPPQGLTVKSQLWNISVINTSGNDITAKLQLTVTDQTNKQRVFTAITRNFNMPKGVKQLRSSDLLPIDYTGSNTLYNIDMSPNGFLPVGNFVFCYSIIEQNASKEMVSEECVEAQVEALAPPMLISPSDHEQLEIPSPLFVWSPPTPRNLFTNLQYELRVAEVMGTQSAGDAIQQNIPLLVQQNIFTTNFQYPLSLPKLDTSKLYAWQIVAKNSVAAVGTSEAWLFRIKKASPDSIKLKTKAVYFTRLGREPGTPAIANGSLYFAYLNETNTNTAMLRLFDVTGSKMNELHVENPDQPLRFGENFITLDLKGISGIVRDHYYLLELVNQINEHWYIKFQYKTK